ncbi:MAG: aminopeptidase [Lachnospiraceae bacterium]|nr:aminopeptidase [Lachnospiraceae bacterium]
MNSFTVEEFQERISDAHSRIALIPGEAAVPAPFREYFSRTAEFLLGVRSDADNRALYADILPENYSSSFANPEYAGAVLGEDYGPVLSAVYAELRGLIPAVFEKDYEGQAVLLELFLQLYFEFENEDVPEVRTVRNIFAQYLKDYAGAYVEDQIAAQVSPDRSFAADIIREADLSDPSYLYRFGEYVTADTERMARYMASLPEEKVRRMASVFVEGYRLGFVNAGKDLSKKKTVQVVYELGYERMIRAAMEEFGKLGLTATFVRSSVRLVTKSPNRHAGYTGAIPNLQFDYDHRDDLALIMDEDYVTLRKRAAQEGFEAFRKEAGEHAGPAVLETFGEPPFAPEMHRYAIRMDKKEEARYLELKNALLMIRQRYIPEEERSFTIIDFPVPAIGDRFEEIFDETIRVNTLDQKEYCEIQQKLIDALDAGTRVHVTGRDGNETDLTVALHTLQNPEKETNFENCLADVNIPVGEVFTTPVLKGTNGLLHVKRVFLEGYEFIDLRLRLKDGMIESYSCGNFEDAEKRRQYIEDNILFHHPTLPIGEFAIGTNTTAYRMGRKYGIEALMPILIAEKTGPHFAMGDTCYGWEEDVVRYNPDGKEIIAKDNEHTLIRKTDLSKAYYGCHTDITIPYDELDVIEVIRPDGSKQSLLAGGRFVLAGTESLNAPLDEPY